MKRLLMLALVIALIPLFCFAESFDGEWYAESNGEKGMTATIADGTIEIYWNMESLDMKPLYWKGSFVVADGSDVVISTASEENAKALLASTAPEKVFMLTDDGIVFEVTAMGMTKQLTLKKKGV